MGCDRSLIAERVSSKGYTLYPPRVVEEPEQDQRLSAPAEFTYGAMLKLLLISPEPMRMIDLMYAVGLKRKPSDKAQTRVDTLDHYAASQGYLLYEERHVDGTRVGILGVHGG